MIQAMNHPEHELPSDNGWHHAIYQSLSIKLPLFRRPAQRKSAWPRIEIGADTMRVGKTTAVTVLAAQLQEMGFPTVVGQEEWQLNPYLTQAYNSADSKDLSSFLYRSEAWFACHKFRQLCQTTNQAIHIQDVPPEMDYTYALTNLVVGRMQSQDFDRLANRFAKLSWTKLPLPDLFIYLTATDQAIVNRANAARRAFETFTDEYLLTMKQLNQLWLAQIQKQAQVLVIDTTNFDFANHSPSQSHLAHQVLQHLSLTPKSI